MELIEIIILSVLVTFTVEMYIWKHFHEFHELCNSDWESEQCLFP